MLTVVIASSLPDIQSMMDLIVDRSERYELFINVDKTNLVVFSKRPTQVILHINNKPVEQVRTFGYLGATVNDQSDPTREIEATIELARRTLASMKNLFTCRGSASGSGCPSCAATSSQSHFMDAGCESWTVDPGMESRIDAFEMYFYRRILRISWVERRSNEDILAAMGKSRELMGIGRERKLRYTAHTMRGEKYEVLRLIIEGILAERNL